VIACEWKRNTMNESVLESALAALHYWALGEVPTTLPEGMLEHVRRTAWQVAPTPTPTSTGWPQIEETALGSIFTRIQKQSTPKQLYLKPVALRLERDVIFPVSEQPQAYTKSALHTAITNLADQHISLAEQLEHTIVMLQTYAWGLPSPLEAVSLYDVARLHAALAAATYGSHNDQVCLIGADISGVQEFIYAIPAKGAAKQLRGRSLYLQLLTDACAHYLLHTTGMPICNVLYAGGGRLYLLAPASAIEQLDAWRNAIGSRFLSAHGGDIYLALGCIACTAEQYSSAIWRTLSDQIDQDKRRRFASLETEQFRRLFEPTPQQWENTPAEDGTDDESPLLDALSTSLQELGGDIPHAKGLRIWPTLPKPLAGNSSWQTVLASFGYSVELTDGAGKRIGAAAPDTQAPYQRLLWLGDAPADTATTFAAHRVVGTRYTVTEARRLTGPEETQLHRSNNENANLRAGDVMPFNLLAEQSCGIKRIGVLRMDVDDLGDLFGKALDRGEAKGIHQLAYTNALSSALSRFFEGWVGELCRQHNSDGKPGGVYAVYSGGDDLFLVGSWDRMPQLAQHIRNDFMRYVHGSAWLPDQQPLISLSAGITLHGGSYPLYQAADQAAEALDIAKGFTRSRHGSWNKDAITFLGRTLSWQQFAETHILYQQLNRLISDHKVPRSLLMAIQSLNERAHRSGHRNHEGVRQFAHGPWIWQGAYQLTRLAERLDRDLEEEVKDIRNRLVGREGISQRTIERAGLAARWAQLSIRENKEEGR
jgi:CRISPR-associated protein Csm1